MSKPDQIAAAFSALLRANPAAPIAWTPSGVRSRADLHALAQSIAALCQELPTGSRIGLSVRDGFTLLAAFLASLRSGHAAILLDAADPRAPRVDVASRLGARAVLADRPQLRLQVCGDGEPAGDVRAIKLTSGSTKEPRAIAVTDAQLCADAHALEHSMGIGDDDRILAAVPMTFSYGVGNLLVPALSRGRVLVLPDASHPIGLLRAMREGEPTVLPAVPALLRALLSGSMQLPGSLRLVLSAGAVLAPDVARRFRERFARPVHVFYGSTETGGICYDRTGTAAERGSVGTPVAGVDVQVRADGHVAVRSPAVGLALDGSRNPDGSQFVAPDLGRFDGGEMWLAGRAGAVFDVGGHKVDPREIEALIERLDDVREVAVLPWMDEQGRASCGAVVAARSVRGIDVRRHCARTLPAAKVPRRIAVVTQLPRNERGKLLRSELERMLAAEDAAVVGGES